MGRINFAKFRNFGGFGKKQVVLAGLVIMIAVAGYINWSYQTEPVVPANAPVTDDQTLAKSNDYFANARYDRDKAKSASMEVFREIVANEQSDAQTKQNAQNDLSKSAKAAETETVIESLIKAKGFEDVVCYIQADSVNVVVKTSGLVPAQVAQIKDLVVEKTGFTTDKIKIQEIK